MHVKARRYPAVAGPGNRKQVGSAGNTVLRRTPVRCGR